MVKQKPTQCPTSPSGETRAKVPEVLVRWRAGLLTVVWPIRPGTASIAEAA